MPRFPFKLHYINLLIALIAYSSVFPKPIIATDLSSPSYIIKMGTINISGGTISSPKKDIRLTDTLGLTAPDQFDSDGFRLRSGFAYLPQNEPFSLEIEPANINLGTFAANTFASAKASLTIHGSGVPGYAIKTIEDHPLQMADSETTIPNTSCDTQEKCTPNHKTAWQDPTSYGFGYSLDGTDFLPFPNNASNQNPVTLVSSTLPPNKQGDITEITFKASVSLSQTNGKYQNSIQFIALPSY